VPNSDFVITRRADIKSTSKYYIDNKLATADEVSDVLIKQGIDLNNNRFLILQVHPTLVMLACSLIVLKTQLRHSGVNRVR
jgi:hypothetical protein